MQPLSEARAWLASQYGQPAVMVVSSPEADRVCGGAHGLTVTDLLRPFGVLSELNGGVGVPVRTAGEHPLRLHSWTLRFYSCSTMFQPGQAAAEAHLSEVITAAAAAAAGDEATPDPDPAPTLQTLVAQAGSGVEATPWFGAYRSELFRMLAFGEHETFDHPVASILVLPSTVGGDPVAAFAELHRSAPLSAALREGVVEGQVLRHYVLLHDAQGPDAGVEERLKAMRVGLGANCHVLTINSGERGVPPTNPRFFQRLMHDPVPGGGAGEPEERVPAPAGGVGAGLSPADMTALASFVQELAERSLIPHLEARIRLLNQSVTLNRKGLKNQLKSLLFRKPGAGAAAGDGGASPSRASAAMAGGAAAYPPSSVEAQMRQLADLAVMLRDYDTALGTLRLLASDYKADKAYKHYAAAQEALGVVTALGAGPAADAVANFKEALYRYNQVAAAAGGAPGARECVRYATRTALALAQYLAALGQHSDGSWVLMKAHLSEGNLAAGLLLEQAAHCLLRLAPPHARKFAFYLVLAGLRFNMCGQRGLALRAYRAVLAVYSGRRWRLVEEHLHDVLGKACREAGDLAGAARHYGATLLCPANSAYCQRLYLAQFLDVAALAAGAQGFPPLLELPVPVVGLKRLGLQFDSQACYSTPEARRLPARAWATLEAALQPADGGPATWLDGGSRVSLTQQQHTCCVGEAVGVDLELSNPLALDLPITRLRLACTFEPTGGAGVAGSSGSTSSEDGGTKGPSFQVREESITLRGGERVLMHLRVVPLRPGRLSLDGVAWVLSGSAHGQQAFKIPRPRPLKPGTNKVALDAEREPPGGLSFEVLPPMPRLEAAVEGLEGTLLAGQVVRATLRLRNTGAMTLKGLRMASSGGDVYLGGSGTADGEAADGLAGGAAGAPATTAPPGRPEAQVVGVSQRQGSTVFSLPAACRLGVGQELLLPIWFRPSLPGATMFRVAWHYEPLVRLDALRFRTLRAAYGVAALPSLQLTADAVAGTSVPGRCLLHLQALNLQGMEGLHLRQLICPSGTWSLAYLEQASSANAEQQQQATQHMQLGMDLQLGPEAAAACYYHLRPAAEGAGSAPPVPASSLSEAERYFQRSSGGQASASSAAPSSREPAGELSGTVDLMVQWEAAAKAGGARVLGYSSVSVPRVKLGPPVHVQLMGPSGSSVVHDFSAAPICTLPLRLRLRNELSAPAAVVIEAGRHVTAAGEARTPVLHTWAATRPASSSSDEPSTSGALQAVGGAVPPLRQYVWSGRTRITLPSLQSGGTVEVAMQVSAAAPGQLAVNDYVVSWSYPGAAELSGSQGGPPCFIELRGGH